jgi:hypothetical protein
MVSCEFRKIYVDDFAYAHKLAVNFIQTLKYRCADLYRHLVSYSIDIDHQQCDKLRTIRHWLAATPVGQHRSPPSDAHGVELFY